MAKRKKRGILSKIFRGIGVLLLLLIIAVIAIPYFFKDEIKAMAEEEASKFLLADFELEDFDLTFLSTFPKMSVHLDGVKLTGRDDFQGVELVNVKSFVANVDFWSVVSGDKVSIEGISLVEPNVNVKVLENGLANYDIVKSDSVVAQENPGDTAAHFALDLKSFKIAGGNIRYHDIPGAMDMDLKALNLDGAIGIDGELYNVTSATDMEAITFVYDGVPYLSSVKTNANIAMDILMTEDRMKVTLAENTISLNAFKASIEGFYDMLQGRDEMDLKLIADQTQFKDLLSLIPAFYRTGYESMATSGTLGMNAYVKGTLDDVNYPGWDVDLNINNASIQYPDLPESIQGINVAMKTTYSGGDNLDKMKVDINKFTAKFAGNTLDADLMLRSVMTDPYIKSRIIANVDLASLDKVMPMAEGESYTGKLKSDLNFDGKYSSIEKEEYDKFKASGMLTLTDMLYASPDLPSPVNVEALALDFTPEKMSLTSLQAKMGKSDFNASGTIDNYLGYALKDEALKGQFNYSSAVLDMDALMSSTGAEETAVEAETETVPTEGEDEVLLIPDNIDFVLKAKIDKLIYDGMEINNVEGDVVLRDERAAISNLKMNALKGAVLLNGSYDTKDHSTPKMDFAYKLSEIDINALTSNFITIEKLAPVAKYAQGLISSEFSMQTNLNADFTPDYNTLSGSGDLLTRAVKLTGFKPLEKVEEVMSLNKLSNNEFRDLKARFQVKDGKLSVQPFDINFGQGISANVNGSTSLEQDIDYTMEMSIPKALIPKQAIDAAEKLIAKANKIPGFKMDGLPEKLKVTTLIQNKITDPKVSTNLKERLVEEAGGLKEGVKNMVDEQVQNVKDTVNAVIDKTKEDLNAAKEAKKKEILAEAQKKADALKAEGEKAANAIRSEADKSAKKLMDEAGGNPLKKKAAELAGDKLKKEAEEKAQKVEREADQRANKLMEEAQNRADNL